MSSFDEHTFRSRVDRALDGVRRILSVERHPTYPADVQHEYVDKFTLVDFVSNTSLAAALTALEALGLTPAALATLRAWAAERSVTLCLAATEHCAYDRKEERKVKSHGHQVKAGPVKVKDYTETKVTEHFWRFDVTYELYAYRGSDRADRVRLQGRTGRVEVKTPTDDEPRPKSCVQPVVEVALTWLLQQLDPDVLRLRFAVHRDADTCRTPRRNAEVDAALQFWASFTAWADRVQRYFTSGLFPLQPSHGYHMGSIGCASVFNPVIPLFEEQSPDAEPRLLLGDGDGDAQPADSMEAVTTLSHAVEPTSRANLALGDLNAFLAEQRRTLHAQFATLNHTFPGDAPAVGLGAAGPGDGSGKGKKKDKKGKGDAAGDGDGKLITLAEAVLLTTLRHAVDVAQAYRSAVDYVEHMLRQQLVSAIGKEVGVVDFANYMAYHVRKLFRPEYQPQPFCYAIRRPDHYPEGEVSIEAHLRGEAMAEAIQTLVRRRETPATGPAMRFALTAASTVSFRGPQYVHAWVSQRFSGESGLSLTLNARARQFSSFIVLVGRIGGPQLFLPKAAMMVQNKDDVTIPLDLETIPTPKEFRDAIESLSPEQQRFCKAFRSMQLESTLFGVVVIQIKPQMEKLLQLPDDSLTKELRLVQDLQELFLQYQVPSDLLTYDGPEHASVEHKVGVVKRYVKVMQDVIQEARDKELADARAKQELEIAQLKAAQVQSVKSSIQSSRSHAVCDSGAIRERSVKGGKRRTRNAAPRAAHSAVVNRSLAPSSSLRRTPAAPPVAAAAAAVATSTSTTTNAPASAPTSNESKPSPDTATSADAPGGAEGVPSTEASGAEGVQGLTDYTKVPVQLDARFEALDTDSALRPTIINPGTPWQKKFQVNLLAKQEHKTLHGSEQKSEKQRTYDLLDALTRSGALDIDAAELHVVIAATHNFDKSVMDTVIEDNVNPIEKLERSLLIVATTIHDKSASELIQASKVNPVSTYSVPALFIEDGDGDDDADDAGKADAE